MINSLAKGYFVNVYDYERASSGLLVSSGAGTMVAVMDACPVFRWCLDIDQNQNGEHLARFLFAADLIVNPFGVVGWFSITPPDALQSALRRLPNLGRVLAYTQQATMPAGFHFDDLGTFIAAANDFESVTAGVLVDTLCWRSGKWGDTDRPVLSIIADEVSSFSRSEALTIRADRQRDQVARISGGETLLGKQTQGQAV